MFKYFSPLSEEIIYLIHQIQKDFEFVSDWHRSPKLNRLLELYFCLLYDLLKQKPNLTDCLVRCRHCGIYFITYYSNKRREDLGCYFGCQVAHFKKVQRNVAPYAVVNRKEKKTKQS